MQSEDQSENHKSLNEEDSSILIIDKSKMIKQVKYSS